MAQTIKLRRSATQGGTPTVSQLSLGEVAINTYDGKMYIKKDSGTASIVEVGGGNLPLTGGTISGHTLFSDNVEARWGNSADLKIYHDGSNSYIKDVGTGTLNIQGATQVLIGSATTGEVGVQFVENAGVNLRHNNIEKLATTATGIDVTGTATMDGLTVDGTSTIATFLRDAGANGSLALTFPAQTTTLTSLSGFKINANSADRFNIASNGDISFYEDTGTTPKFFWDASAESLGIGTSAPAARLHVNGGRSTFYSGDNYAVGVGNAAGVLGGYMGSPSVNVLTFSEPGGLERMRLDAAGDLTVKVGNLVIGTSGKGIDFSANGNAGGMTSELLDDYEEGTWTPVLTPHSGTAPTTSTTNSGSYTKVGRLVTVIGFIQIDAISGVTSGVVNISLPFTPVSTAGYMPSGPVTPNGMNFTRPDIVTITIYSGATAGFLTANNAGGWDWETFSIFSAADALRFSLSFNTA